MSAPSPPPPGQTAPTPNSLKVRSDFRRGGRLIACFGSGQTGDNHFVVLDARDLVRAYVTLQM